MTCSARFNIQSEEFISQLEHCRKIKFSLYVHQTLMYTKSEQCYGTSPLSRCYHDKMKTNLSLELLLNQFKWESSFLGRRTYPDN